MTRQAVVRSALLWAALSAGGCGESPAEGVRGPAQDEPECVPDAGLFASEVRPLFERYCGHCHGAIPQGGAPFGLLEHAPLVAETDGGERIVDAVARVLAASQMPPGGHPRPSASERARMLAWTRCDDLDDVPDDLPDAATEHDGGLHAGHDGGLSSGGPLTVSREPVQVAEAPPGSAQPIAITLDEFTPPLSGDHYESKTFAKLVSEDRFIRYFEPIVDDGRVVHHLTLRFGGAREGYVYVWAPGGEGMEFPEGGIRLGPADTLRLEVHYHNGSGVPDVQDSSGVRLYVAEPVGTEYGVANLASWEIFVPAGGTGTASSACTVPEDVHVFAALPHMHQIGDALAHRITRVGGAEESLIELTGWDFHSQRAYAVGLELAAGDRLDLTCRYVNPTSSPVFAGTASTDEMCFDFLYVTPPNALAPCNDSLSQ